MSNCVDGCCTFICPECGSEDTGFYVRGERIVVGREAGTFDLVLGCNGGPFDISDFEMDEWIGNEYVEEDLPDFDEIYCNACGEVVIPVPREGMTSEEVEALQKSRVSWDTKRSKSRIKRSDVTSPDGTILKPHVLKEAADKIHKSADLDFMLEPIPNCGYVAYKIGPDCVGFTPSARRLFELGRELVACGFEGVNPYEDKDDKDLMSGDLTFRLWALTELPADNLFELDQGSPREVLLNPEQGEIRHIMLIGVVEVTPMGLNTVKTLAVGVPWFEAKESDDWDDQVFIADITDPEGDTWVFDNMERWDGDTFEKLEWYRCERSSIRQTLEVVFDITPGGYIPLKKEAREKAMLEMEGVAAG